jgi:hypothetical protein
VVVRFMLQISKYLLQFEGGGWGITCPGPRLGNFCIRYMPYIVAVKCTYDEVSVITASNNNA